MSKKELTIGTILKTYRTNSKISIDKVASSLNVKKQDILDLEKDLIKDKKPHTYVSGLIRSYRNLLKIDDSILDKRISEFSKNVNKSDKNKLIENNKYIYGKKYFIYAIFMLLLAYIIFFYDSLNEKITTDLIIEKINKYETQF